MNKNTVFVPDAARVSCIELSLEGCDIVVRRGERFGLDGNAVSFAQCGVWHIRAEAERMTLILPDNFEAMAFRLKVSGGSARLCSLNALDIVIRISGGVLVTEKLSARSIHAELGSGTAEICAAPILSAFLECGIGRMNVKLDGVPEDYRIRTERGIGKLAVSGRETARRTVVGNGQIDVFARCGMGEMFLGFTDIAL